MVVRNPLVLVSGCFSQLPYGDTVPGTDIVAQASGNAALVLATQALRPASETVSGIAAIATQVEVNQVTNDLKIVTPLKLGTYVSQNLWIDGGSAVSNFGSAPAEIDGGGAV